MKTIYTAMLVLLCWAGIQAQEHEYVPMLREDLVWVGFTDHVGEPNLLFHIVAKGDTVIEGTIYKKMFRVNHFPWPPAHLLHTSALLSDSIPAALLREENGKVYRLFNSIEDPTNLYNGCYDWDGGDTTTPSDNYLAISNLTGTHYEAVIYDFDEPDVYARQKRPFERIKDVTIEHTARRVYDNGAKTLIEGVGALFFKDDTSCAGVDVLCPGRESDQRTGFGCGMSYVANTKGEILLYEDRYVDGYCSEEEGIDIEYAYHPYNLNHDGVFDIEDLNETINHVLNLPTTPFDKFRHTADVNFDGTIDIEDIGMMVNQLLYHSRTIRMSDVVAGNHVDANRTAGDVTIKSGAEYEIEY